MRSLIRAASAVLAAVVLTAAAVVPASAQRGMDETLDAMDPRAFHRTSTHEHAAQAGDGLRVATFNASLHRAAPGDLIGDLLSPNNAQAQAVAEIIQRTAPDVVLLNEFDYDDGHEAAGLFRANYLATGQNGQQGIDYPYVYTAPSNTGVGIGADLDKDGAVGGPADNFGYGDFEGQYGMVLYSKHPIVEDQVRTFQRFLWKDMPENLLPTDYYGPLVSKVFRLSSKSHWDVPVRVGGRTVHLLASHPTPPVFDGEERRNARRNHDEIRFWSDYVSGGDAAGYVYDDAGTRGGLEPDADFVVLGDLNADPSRGDSYDGAVSQLLGHPALVDPRPSSPGAVTGSRSGLQSFIHPSTGVEAVDPAAAAELRTADFGSAGPLRVDYVLPSATLGFTGSGVFWPAAEQDGARLVGGHPPRSSDHRLVWVDIAL
ncbi:endonuclease/exonuclease/phosphatase family protein [Zafaria sp. Z1313]|uniref:endonuclease/exonuclease/phosphatase family protein n=1 Tax=unclassified Zafaria TaxID=2828765 RepID=UPI002E790651|nr:endonuclease/exonuclease/phosphatase family protein [Zafaria sp. J156]MEE1622105.1 endonuclease/exonuclease/phosphatase family protein [Zafaria sp. J156]